MSAEDRNLENYRRPLFKRRPYAKKQRAGAWIWVVGPALLVAGAVAASVFGPVEDGVELEPTAQADIVSERDG